MTTEQPSRIQDDGYQRSLEMHRRLEALYSRLEQHRAYFRGLSAFDPTLPHPPGKRGGVRLDPVVCALAIKAATTKRAILALCELGDGDNALALTRVLLENACLLEWLIRGDGRRRLESYVRFMSVQHERIADTIARHRARFIADDAPLEVLSDPYHRAVWEHTFRDGKSKRTTSDRPTWEFDRATGQGRPVSVKALFHAIADADQSFEHDVLYGALGSDIVHSGPFALTGIYRLLGDREIFVLQPMADSRLCTIALASSNTAMFLVLDSLSEYIGLDLWPELAELKAGWKAGSSALTELVDG
jgi:hypothetical protein